MKRVTSTGSASVGSNKTTLGPSMLLKAWRESVPSCLYRFRSRSDCIQSSDANAVLKSMFELFLIECSLDLDVRQYAFILSNAELRSISMRNAFRPREE